MRQISTLVFWIVLMSLYIIPSSAAADQQTPAGTAPISDDTQTCIECHEEYTPGIVGDWRTSRHARTTPTEALQKPTLERRMSGETIPETLQTVAVGCYECHSLNPDRHEDNFEHFGYEINIVVSPNDCSTCHPVEAEEYGRSKKAHALDNLQQNPVYHLLVETATSVNEVQDGNITRLASSETAKGETCYGCHGTRVTVAGVRETDAGEVPVLTNWPNQGVGRVNPDGSLGACTACHPRHSFSVEIARKPYTCAQCHLEPDLPAWNVYHESKHGNIFLSRQQAWNWDRIPWRVGEDFQAPTCATCHNSLLVSPAGDVIAARSHDFGDRLWVRIFGLIYSHPQPKDGRTYLIRNSDGQPLPTTFTGQPASEYLLDEAEQKQHKTAMENVCRACHSPSWVEGHFAQMDTTLIETDKMVHAAMQLMTQAWNEGLADPSNPFDEAIERKWLRQWLFYANSVRYAAAMSGPDYAAFKNGWAELTKNLQDMKEAIELKRKK